MLSALPTSSPHEVQRLPGYEAPLPTRHFSGFIEVEKGTSLFYYVVESASDPASDPLVWWMNGGPGASSLVGLIAENGPLLLTGSGALTPNPWAWNARANLLYVEFGPGIGYSYCANSSAANASAPCPQASGACSPCYASDASVAAQSAAFYQGFVRQFPRWEGTDLYLAGESSTSQSRTRNLPASRASPADQEIDTSHPAAGTPACTCPRSPPRCWRGGRAARCGGCG